MQSNLKKFAIAAALILGIGSMSACGPEVQGEADHTKQATTDNAQKAFDEGITEGPTNIDEGSIDEGSTDEAATEPDVPSDLKWGESYVYEDGIEITLSKPEVMAEPGNGETWKEYVDFDESMKKELANGIPVKMTLQIRNKGSEVIDPSMATITTLAGEETLDSSCIDVDCSFTVSKLLPGRNVKSSWTYFIPKNLKNDLTVEVQPDWDHDSAVYLDGLDK
jgi:hypothetical protein